MFFVQKKMLLRLFVHLRKSHGKSWNCIESPGNVLELWQKEKVKKVLKSPGIRISFFWWEPCIICHRNT